MPSVLHLLCRCRGFNIMQSLGIIDQFSFRQSGENRIICSARVKLRSCDSQAYTINNYALNYEFSAIEPYVAMSSAFLENILILRKTPNLLFQRMHASTCMRPSSAVR